MNWEAIGAIGEVVGAAVVGVTLIYLIIQVKQNSVSINANITQANIAAFNELNALLASDEELSAILEKGTDHPQTLSESENRRFTWLMRSYLNLYLNLFDQYRQGTCSPELWDRHALELSIIAPSPGIKAFRQIDSTFNELFAFVENMNLDVKNLKLEHRIDV